ncbi:MAG: hypothetical protein IKQ99_01970 [Alphaproteobacteria bacterium]|nr:hypothetical protein [Alphaproteobacteria bacterium]
MSSIKLEKKKDRFELYLFGKKIVFYRYLRMLREIFLMLHYDQLKEALKTNFNITLPKEAYHHLSGDVEVVEVSLKDLKVPCSHRRTCSIPETKVYKWLESDRSGDCDWTYNEAGVYIPESQKQLRKRMENLVVSLAEKYDPSKCVITVRKNNTIIDGQHRAAALYYKRGGNYKVVVVRER